MGGVRGRRPRARLGSPPFASGPNSAAAGRAIGRPQGSGGCIRSPCGRVDRSGPAAGEAVRASGCPPAHRTATDGPGGGPGNAAPVDLGVAPLPPPASACRVGAVVPPGLPSVLHAPPAGFRRATSRRLPVPRAPVSIRDLLRLPDGSGPAFRPRGGVRAPAGWGLRQPGSLSPLSATRGRTASARGFGSGPPGARRPLRAIAMPASVAPRVAVLPPFGPWTGRSARRAPDAR